MKKTIAILLIGIIITFAFGGCESSNKMQNDISNNVSITVKYDRLATDDDFKKYNNVDLDVIDKVNVPEKYNKMIKLTATVNNSSNESLVLFDTIESITDDVYITSGMVDYEPTCELVNDAKPKDIDLYVYVTSNLSSDKKIKDALSKCNISFSANVSKDDPSLSIKCPTLKSNFVY